MIVVDCPVNNLSFGNVSYNILRELYRRGEDVSLFLLGDRIDASAFDKIDPDFKVWIEQSYQNRYNTYDSDLAAFKLWHLNGSIDKKTNNQFLYTFYECSQPTTAEIAIAKSQKHTFFSSSYSNDHFVKCGVKNSSYIPVGFDPDFVIKNVKKPSGIQFGLMGKYENRKRTEKIVKLWLKKYGNQRGYYLNLLINNPFFSPEEMQQLLANLIEEKRYFNLNIVPPLKTNTEVNQFLNFIDIDLTGLSGGEGWNLPAFNATALGKWSIVLNATSHKDWATSNNSVLVEPEGIFPCYDGKFFQEGAPFNQGVFFDVGDETTVTAMETAVKKAGQVNSEGIKLQTIFSYRNMVDKLLSHINASI